MQFPVWSTVKSFYAKIFVFKQPCLGHFYATGFCKPGVFVLDCPDIFRVVFRTKFYKPLFIIVTGEYLGSCATGRATALLKIIDTCPVICIAIQYLVSLQRKFLEIRIIVVCLYTIVGSEFQCSAT